MNKKVKAELIFVFSQLFSENLKKVPEALQEEIIIDFDEEHLDSFDRERPFTEQRLSVETLEILLKIFDI